MNYPKHKFSLLHHIYRVISQQVNKQDIKIQQQARQNQLLTNVALKIRASLSLETILNTTVTEVQQLLQADRVLIYRFESDGSGTVVVESVAQPEWSILNRVVKDECFEQKLIHYYDNYHTKAITDINKAGLSDCYIKFLQKFQVKAALIVPLLLDDMLWGLLIAHQCSDIREWQPEEKDLLENLSIQVAIAIQQATLLEQVQKANVELEAKVAQRTAELRQLNQALHIELTRTQQAEAALREGKAVLRSFYDTSPMMMGVVELLDDDILHLSDNASAAKFFGATTQTMHNQLASQMGAGEDNIRTWINHYRESQRTGQPVRFEYSHQQGETIKWLSATVSYIGESVNYRPQFSYIVEDVSDRKHSEEALRQSEERWQLALRGSNDGVWDWNLKTNEVFFSARWKEMLGYEDHEISHNLDEWTNRVHPDDLNLVLETVQNHFAQKIPFYITEHRVQCKDGSYKWILDRGQALWDENNHVVRMTGSHTDITERKQAEEQLRATSSRLAALIENLQAGVLVEDETRKIALINQQFCHLFGIIVSSEALLGADCNQLVQQSKQIFINPDATLKRIEQILQEKRVVTAEEINLIDGRTLERDYIPVFVDQQYQGHLWQYRDITQRKLSEMALRESQARLGLINSILTGITTGMTVEQIISFTVYQLSEYFSHYRVAYSIINEEGILTVIHALEPSGMPSQQELEVDLSI
ncbi:PAS domain S-box protein, partial [Anabaena sp. 4-3]